MDYLFLLSYTFCIAIDILVVIKRELGSFPEWKELGLNLGLHPSALNVIEKNHRSVKEQLHQVLEDWLRMKDNIDEGDLPTWSRLAEAVEPIDRALSITIKKKHC